MIKLKKKAIAEQGQRLAIYDQLSHILLHDGDLHVVASLNPRQNGTHGPASALSVGN